MMPGHRMIVGCRGHLKKFRVQWRPWVMKVAALLLAALLASAGAARDADLVCILANNSNMFAAAVSAKLRHLSWHPSDSRLLFSSSLFFFFFFFFLFLLLLLVFFFFFFFFSSSFLLLLLLLLLPLSSFFFFFSSSSSASLFILSVFISFLLSVLLSLIPSFFLSSFFLSFLPSFLFPIHPLFRSRHCPGGRRRCRRACTAATCRPAPRKATRCTSTTSSWRYPPSNTACKDFGGKEWKGKERKGKEGKGD